MKKIPLSLIPSRQRMGDKEEYLIFPPLTGGGKGEGGQKGFSDEKREEEQICPEYRKGIVNVGNILFR